jgi:hypothetical protein
MKCKYKNSKFPKRKTKDVLIFTQYFDEMGSDLSVLFNLFPFSISGLPRAYDAATPPAFPRHSGPHSQQRCSLSAPTDDDLAAAEEFFA